MKHIHDLEALESSPKGKGRRMVEQNYQHG
jgi:hypothetical protein